MDGVELRPAPRDYTAVDRSGTVPAGPREWSKRVRRARVGVASLGVTVLISGCGSSPQTRPSPSPAQLSGVWTGEQTVTDFTGGECLGSAFEGFVGLPSQFHATLTQSGNSLTATLDIGHTGDVCTYTGTIEGSALQLTVTSCTESKTVGLRCANGALRDVLPASEAVHATAEGNTITGTALEIDNVVVAGTSDSVGALVSHSSFALTRQ
jgi:hypothetical protein